MPEDIMVDTQTIYQTIEGGSRMGGDLLTDILGFQYVKKRTTSVSTSWICSVRTKAQKKVYKRQSKKQDSKQQKLKQLWTAFENHDIITSDYLKECSSLADHAED